MSKTFIPDLLRPISPLRENLGKTKYVNLGITNILFWLTNILTCFKILLFLRHRYTGEQTK